MSYSPTMQVNASASCQLYQPSSSNEIITPYFCRLVSMLDHMGLTPPMMAAVVLNDLAHRSCQFNARFYHTVAAKGSDVFTAKGCLEAGPALLLVLDDISEEDRTRWANATVREKVMLSSTTYSGRRGDERGLPIHMPSPLHLSGMPDNRATHIGVGDNHWESKAAAKGLLLDMTMGELFVMPVRNYLFPCVPTLSAPESWMLPLRSRTAGHEGPNLAWLRTHRTPPVGGDPWVGLLRKVVELARAADPSELISFSDIHKQTSRAEKWRRKLKKSRPSQPTARLVDQARNKERAKEVEPEVATEPEDSCWTRMGQAAWKIVEDGVRCVRDLFL